MPRLPEWLRPTRPACPDEACDFRRQPDVVHHSLDGRVFRVRRLACAVCGRRKRTAVEQRQTDPDGPHWWRREPAVEANF